MRTGYEIREGSKILAERRNAHIAKCPHCGSRNAWLAQKIWTCHRCHHSWPIYRERDLANPSHRRQAA